MAGEGNLATCGLSERESHHTGNWNRAWDANNLTASLMDALGFWLIYNSKLDWETIGKWLNGIASACTWTELCKDPSSLELSHAKRMSHGLGSTARLDGLAYQKAGMSDSPQACVCFWPFLSPSHPGNRVLGTCGKPLVGYPVPEFMREDPKALLTEMTKGIAALKGELSRQLGGLKGIGQWTSAVASGVTLGIESSSVHFHVKQSKKEGKGLRTE